MNCDCNYQKSTFLATGMSATVPAGGTLVFGTTQQITGNAIQMGINNASINLYKKGLYQVSVNATATASADATQISMQLNRDGVAIPSGNANFTMATADGNAISFGFDTIINVEKPPAGVSGKAFIPLTLTSTGGEAIYSFLEVMVVKIA